MTGDTDKSDELLRLLAELVDGRLTRPQVDRLRSLLRDDPGAQDLYRGYMNVHAQLHLDYNAGATPPAMPGGSSMPAVPDLSRPIDPNGDILGALSRGAWPRGPRRAWRGVATPAIGGALAASLLAVAVAALAWPRDRREARSVSVAALRATPDAGEKAAPARLAQVIKLEGVRWEPADGTPPAEGEVVPARRLRLGAGRATLALLSGVTLTLEGPADVELVAIDRVFCRRGRLRARVPSGAEGFVVAAPGSAVADLGTEFAMNVDVDGKTRLMVFEGEAEAALLDAAGTPERSQHVVQSEAFVIDPRRGDITEAVASVESFIRPPVLDVPGLDLAPSYPSAVLESRPWGYWRFEAMEGGATPNQVPGGPPLRATGPVTVDTSHGNGCAAFAEGEAIRYLTLDGDWTPPVTPGYAVELWVLPQEFDHSTLVALRVKPGVNPMLLHCSLLELTAPGRHPLWKPASVRLLHRWPPGVEGGTNVFSDRLYAPYRWQHLLAQKNGGGLELYIDGELERALPIDTDQAPAAFQVLVGQMTTGEGQRPFFGRIDELALYDRPLAAEEIRRHARLATPRASKP